MKKILFLLLGLIVFSSWLSKADEGMWLPSLIGKLNIEQMNSMGLKLTADQIYNINHSSLKDAVVALDRGSCTAELVSNDGLLLTNHHCGYGQIQKHSSVEHDYLKNGFWAATRDQELPNPGKSATFLVRMEEVTEQIMKNVSDTMSNGSKMEAILKAISKIEKDAKGDTQYEVRVRTLFEGNAYYLFVTETFKDIRLVGAPPQSIGKFGGDTDNWIWPRHTGDFSMFRIYCSPDGKPAEFAKENVPYHPKHHFPISLKGIEKNDFAMIMGYPGRTNRYLTSYGVKYTMDYTNAIRIKVREAKLAIIGEYMAKSDNGRIQYSNKFYGSSNYYKYSIGQNKGLDNLNVIDKKIAIEKEFSNWVNATPERKTKYGEAISNIAKSYQSIDDKVAYEYAREALMSGAEIINFSTGSSSLYEALKSNDKDKIKQESERIKASLADFYKDFDGTTDQKVAAKLMKIYADNVAKQFHPKFFDEINKKYKGNYDEFTKKMYAKSIFSDQKKFEAFLNNPSLKTLDKDIVYNAMKDVINTVKKIAEDFRLSTADLEKGKKLFVAGLNEMNSGKKLYPDANSTMRLTFGKVGDYEPRDGVFYSYFTTLKGYKEKGIIGDVDFDYPTKIIDMYNAADYGRFADKDGTLHTCFTTNNDITGGNSGSPVLNAKGELIGIAFDGNWEAMSGDIAFEPELQKCINVDIRFVLWTIEKFAGAKHIVDEMTIVN